MSPQYESHLKNQDEAGLILFRDGSTDDGTEISQEQRKRIAQLINQKKLQKSENNKRRQINYTHKANISIDTTNPIIDSISKDSAGTINSSRFNRLMHRL